MPVSVSAEIVGPLLELAMGHGLVDDLLQQDLAKSDAIDLINRLLLADVIDAREAVRLINSIVAAEAVHCR
jgi:hypothetical protein